MRLKNIMTLLVTLATALIMLSGCVGGSVEKDDEETSGNDATVLRLASDAPIEHIANELNTDLADMVKDRTDGRVEIDYHPASQLGGYETVYEEIVRGSVDLGQITIPETTDPRLGAAYIPYYAKNYEEAQVLFASDAYLTEEIGKLTEENDVAFLGFVLEGFIGHGFVKEPDDMTNPEADKGVNSRSPTGSTFRTPALELGFNPVAVPYDEVPTAIQTNVVDGWVGGTPNMNYAFVGEMINYMYVDYIHAEATSYLASNKTLEKLSSEDAEIVKEAMLEQSEQSFKLAEENEEEYKQKLVDDYDVEVIEFTEEQIDDYADFVRKEVWPLLEDDLTKEFVDGLRDEVEKLE